MAIIRKNIWLAFYVIVITWITVFAFASHYKYWSIYNQAQFQQKNITLSTENSLRSLFRKFEIVLDMLVINFETEDNRLPEIEKAQRLMDSAINIDKSIFSFGLFTPDGKAHIASSNVIYDKPPNLLDNPETKDTFIDTLSKSTAVIGRTYYSNTLQKLIMPIRKTIRNQEGEPVYIISSGINVEKAFEFMLANVEDGVLKDSYLFREYDKYFQVAPNALLRNHDTYHYQVPSKVLDAALVDLKKQIGVSYEQLKNNEKLITHETSINNDTTLVASVFLKKYQLWLTTATSLNSVEKTFIEDMLVLSGVFVASLFAIFFLFRNIEKSESVKKRALKFQANHDHLTKLKNRFFLDHQKEKLDSSGDSYSLVYINLDNFKSINDNYGHEIGDSVLKEMALRLSSIIRKNDILVRFSGDEFIVIFFNVDTKELKQHTKEILSELAKDMVINEYPLKLSASIGIARYPLDGSNFTELKKNADLAMHEAKKSRNARVFFNEKFKKDFLFKLQIEHELKFALENKELSVLFQPQISNEGALHGVEALVRWNNKCLGEISPFFFIPIAESSGLMPEIGLFVMQQSMTQCQKVMTDTGIKFDLSVNVSVKQFLQPQFFDDVMSTLSCCNFQSPNLILELTESVFIEDLELITELLNKFRAEGIRVSLDDFGTGFSSLSLLRQLPLDEVKIDKSFVDDMVENKDAYSMVEGIMAISKKLNLKSVAEGVENAEQKDLLIHMGCDILQGYFFSKPISSSKLLKFIKNK